MYHIRTHNNCDGVVCDACDSLAETCCDVCQQTGTPDYTLDQLVKAITAAISPKNRAKGQNALATLIEQTAQTPQAAEETPSSAEAPLPSPEAPQQQVVQPSQTAEQSAETCWNTCQETGTPDYSTTELVQAITAAAAHSRKPAVQQALAALLQQEPAVARQPVGDAINANSQSVTIPAPVAAFEELDMFSDFQAINRGIITTIPESVLPETDSGLSTPGSSDQIGEARPEKWFIPFEVVEP